MTPQPCVSCWSAMVEYLLVSPWAFWMSTSNPASSRPSCRYLRSKFSQRGEEAASGRITHARSAASPPPLLEEPPPAPEHPRSEEHTSELQSLMRISYAVFCLKKKKQK